jgi:hypothetical protein
MVTVIMFSDTITDEYKTLNHYRALVEQKKQDSQRLNLQKIRLEQLVECFLNSNEVYLSIKETIKREVEHSKSNKSHYFETM